MYATPGTAYPTTHRVKRLAENPRTAAKAAIKRASKSARSKLRKLDAEQIRQLERAYQSAIDDLELYLKGRAGDDNTLRLEVMRDLTDQANARLAALATERDDLLNAGLFNAADLGTQPFAGTGMALTKVADDAVRKVTQFVADDGLQLSTRIWNLNHQADEVVTQAIQRSIIQGHSASQAAQEFLARGANIPADLAKNISAAQWDKIYAKIKNGLLTGDGSAYANAKRVFRTELNRAHGEAYMGAAFDHPDVIGTRFLLSPNHPKPDICDMHARVNRYGLGPGVYPKDKNPWPAHPNTLSFVEVVFADEVSAEDRAGKQNRIDWLKQQHPGIQEGVLGSRRKRAALDRDLLKENQIATPWRDLKKRYERMGIKIDDLTPQPLVAPIAPGTRITHKEALNYCRTQGQKTGWEWAVFYDADTGDLLVKKTSKHHAQVRFTRSEVTLLDNPANNIQLVHNHPSSSSLSVADLNMSSLNGVHSVVAIGHDGSTYIAKALTDFRALEKTAEKVNSLISDQLWPLISQGTLSRTEANQIYAHLRNRALADADIITYRTENISGALKAALNSLGQDRFNAMLKSITEKIGG